MSFCLRFIIRLYDEASRLLIFFQVSKTAIYKMSINDDSLTLWPVNS